MPPELAVMRSELAIACRGVAALSHLLDRLYMVSLARNISQVYQYREIWGRLVGGKSPGLDVLKGRRQGFA